MGDKKKGMIEKYWLCFCSKLLFNVYRVVLASFSRTCTLPNAFQFNFLDSLRLDSLVFSYITVQGEKKCSRMGKRTEQVYGRGPLLKGMYSDNSGLIL